MKSGQALIIVLLILAVASALGLSTVSRSVNEINLATTQDDSSQALSAAESGIEAVLKGNADGSPLADQTQGSAGTATYKVSGITALGNAATYEVSKSLASGESAPLFLRQPNSAGNFVDSSGTLIPNPKYSAASFVVCWGKTVPNPQPALEVLIYYKNGLNYGRQLNLFDASPTRSGTVSPAGGAGPTCNNPYPGTLYQTQVGIPAGEPLFATFRMLYNTNDSHPVRVVGQNGGIFPSQGGVYEVEGQSGQTTRRVQVTETFPAPLGILDNALFSGTNL